MFFFSLSLSQSLVWLAFYQSYALAARRMLVVFRLQSIYFSFTSLLSCVLCSEWNRFCPFQPGTKKWREKRTHTLTDFNRSIDRSRIKTGKPTNKTPTTVQWMHIAHTAREYTNSSRQMLAHFEHGFFCMFSIEFLVQITTITTTNTLVYKTRLLQFRLHGN